MKRRRSKPAFASALVLGTLLSGCSVLDSDFRSAAVEIGISAEPGPSCEFACFDVQSSDDVGFIAVDADGCSREPVELSLFRLDGGGDKTWVSADPAPYGNGRTCPDIPAHGLKFDGLSDRRWVVCTSGAERVRVHAKAGKTCAFQAFEIDGGAPSDRPTDWLRQMGPSNHYEPSDVAGNPSGSLTYAQLDPGR